MIEIPQDILLNVNKDPVRTICQFVYGNFTQNYLQKAYLQMTAIVKPYNKTVDNVNYRMFSLLPGDTRMYLSCDNISKSASYGQDQDLNSFLLEVSLTIRSS